MPPSADLIELLFMGPGLLCFVVILLGLFPAIRTWRAHHPNPVARAETLLREGKLEEARAVAYRAVALVRTAEAHFCLGRVLARSADDDEALTHFRLAEKLSQDRPALRSLVLVNMSLVLRRLGQAEEAVAQATEAVRIQDELEPSDVPIQQAGAGWARIALAMAQSDAGQDGRPTAQAALRIFDKLAEFEDGLAHVYLANAYVYKAQNDPAAQRFARIAWQRFKRLHEQTPALYWERLPESEELMRAVERSKLG